MASGHLMTATEEIFMTLAINDHLVLVGGKTTTGKSASLMYLDNPEGVMYLNCESGKRLPFKANFKKGPDGNPGFTIVKPEQVYEAFEFAEVSANVHTIVVDSQTYLMDMFESVNVLTASDTMKAWGQYAQYWKRLMQHFVASSSKSVIFTAHTMDIFNEAECAIETKVPVKGALKNQGIESYFSLVISTKRLTLKALEPYSSPMLNITADDKLLGFKHVFQTRLTADTVGERIRGPIGMFDVKETYIDNNMQFILDRLNSYYGTVATTP